MHFNTRNVVVSVLLVGAVAATWYFDRIGQVTPTAIAPDASAPPGYYLLNAVLLGTNDEGRILYRILAERVSENAEGTALALRSVRVEFRESEDIGWQVSAANASAASDQSFLDLSGGVRLTGNAERGAAATVIETENLRLSPEDYLASTTDEVAVSLGGHRLSATGMDAYLRDDRLELKSQVHGQFRN